MLKFLVFLPAHCFELHFLPKTSLKKGLTIRIDTAILNLVNRIDSNKANITIKLNIHARGAMR